MLDRQMKLLLRVGALLVALVSVVTLISPSSTANALGMPLDLDPTLTLWLLRTSAGALLTLGGFMALAAAFLPERALRQGGALVILLATFFGVMLIAAPSAWRWGRIGALLLCVAFIPFTIKALRARMRRR
jgi:hypothetical protein